MTFLMIIAAVMVTSTMAVAIITAREIETLKGRLSKLEEQKEATYKQWEETEQYRASIQGTCTMLKQLRLSKIEQKNRLNTELEELREEAVENKDISLSKPMKTSPLDESDF